jgi:hypothetical protein
MGGTVIPPWQDRWTFYEAVKKGDQIWIGRPKFKGMSHFL